MRLKSLSRRRPSAALVVSFVALFVALGGAGWAAVNLPAGSVGTRQLQNGAVTTPKIRNLAVNFNKIAFGTVGIRRINTNTVQVRVDGSCSGATGAIGAIDDQGRATCNSTQPTEFQVSANASPVGTSSTTVVTKALPPHQSYLGFANPYASITGSSAGQSVTVTCTLSADGVSTTRSAAVEIGPSKRTLQTAIPIVMPVPSASTASNATLACSQSSTPASPTPTVTVLPTLNLLQVAANS